MVQTKEGTFASVAHDGATIHTKAWLPDESAPPVAVVVWSHGVHEHLGRFERLYERFVRARIATYAWDHVGHGKSGFSGGKSHQFAAGFDAVVADAVQFAKCAFPLALPNPAGRIHPSPASSRRPFPPDASPTARVLLPRVAGASAKYPSTVPVFLGGVSFGGLVVAHACLATPDARWAGVVLAAPAVNVKWNPALRLQASAGALLARLAPHFRGVAAVPPERLSRDPDAIREYVEDPLVRVANVRFLAAYQILEGFRGLERRRGRSNAPGRVPRRRGRGVRLRRGARVRGRGRKRR